MGNLDQSVSGFYGVKLNPLQQQTIIVEHHL